jgi:hypothetical protein
MRIYKVLSRGIKYSKLSFGEKNLVVEKKITLEEQLKCCCLSESCKSLEGGRERENKSYSSI